MRLALLLLLLFTATTAEARIPATPVMTLYRFNGPASLPYYEVESFRRQGTATPAGTLAQGSALIPCLVLVHGEPLTDRAGVPYVGFHLVADARSATPETAQRFLHARRERQNLLVANHHCPADVRHVLDVRNLYDLSKPPLFEPPLPAPVAAPVPSAPSADYIVRTFHNSPYCAAVNQRLTNRRAALQRAWELFLQDTRGRWPQTLVERARHLDYIMRTAIFEGHLERGCSAYGSCERNIVALSIRNRARESCQKHHGCSAPGDFAGVASTVSQYNIWDEYLTQISGLTSCFLRSDLGQPTQSGYDFRRLQRLYEQNIAEVEAIVYGSDQDLQRIFPGNSLADLKGLRHYYHPPAMGKCFPRHGRVEYMSGAVARRGRDFALIADTRIQVGEKVTGGYLFRSFRVLSGAGKDETRVLDNYPGFVVDGRRVTLQPASRCTAYGIPAGCGTPLPSDRHRKTPSWVNDGRPLAVQCRIRSQGAQCRETPTLQTVRVGGVCDTEMQPFTGVR